MKYQFMKRHKDEFKIERMSSVFDVSRSGYYKFIIRIPSDRAQENYRLLGKIKDSYLNSRKTYGSPRVCSELRAGGETCSRKRVARIMKEYDMAAKMKKRFKVTTKANPNKIPAPNLLNQNFAAKEPDQRWVADFTYVDTKEGWLYVAAVMDLFSRRIVGLAMSDRMKDDLVIAALQQALTHRHPNAGLIHHSDRGSQYASKDFRGLLMKYCIVASMSGTGNCYDNAVIESFFHTLKTEHIYFEQYETREQAKRSIFEYVEVFYNRQRRHSTLKYMSPVVFEKQWQQEVRGFSS
ncbi:MAG: IS3 family transposase [Methylomarinum sp.]|nr:IS3 family transposase [Methylomarinum sp.]